MIGQWDMFQLIGYFFLSSFTIWKIELKVKETVAFEFLSLW